MKRLYFILPLVAGLLYCTSCKKDEAEKPETPSARPSMTYKVTLNDTVLHFFHVTLSYRGSDSRTHSLELSDSTWNLTENAWGDSLGMRLQFSLREGVDTAYASAAYIRDGKLDLRIVTQARAVKTNADGSASASYGDPLPSVWVAYGMRLDNVHFTGVVNSLNRRFSHGFTALN